MSCYKTDFVVTGDTRTLGASDGVITTHEFHGAQKFHVSSVIFDAFGFCHS